MSDIALVAHQVRYEQKAYWRNPANAFFTFAFPLVFFFIFNTLFGSQHMRDLGGVKAVQYYTPSILGYAVMSTCFVSITLTLVQRRESGQLKRLRGTPLPSWTFIGGVLGNSLINTVLLCIVTLTFARLVYAVSLPASHLLPIVVSTVVAALAFCAIGIAVSIRIPNIDSGPAIINLPYIVLVFISGGYFPVTGTLGHVAAVFPLRPFILALYRAFNPHVQGSVWAWHDLQTVAIWGVVAAVVAGRRFRWEPRRG